MDTLCRLISNGCWHTMRALSIADNMLSADSVLSLVHACCTRGTNKGTPTLQYLHIPYTHALLDMLEAAEQARKNFGLRIREVLKQSGRDDIDVYVTTRTYAVFL